MRGKMVPSGRVVSSTVGGADSNEAIADWGIYRKVWALITKCTYWFHRNGQ